MVFGVPLDGAANITATAERKVPVFDADAEAAWTLRQWNDCHEEDRKKDEKRPADQ